MTALRATFHFKIRELFLEPGLLATSHELQRGPYVLRFIFPIESDSERNETDLAWSELDRRFPTRDRFAPLEEFERRRTGGTISMGSLPAVTVVRVDCHFDAPFGVRDFAGLEESRNAPVLRANGCTDPKTVLRLYPSPPEHDGRCRGDDLAGVRTCG